MIRAIVGAGGKTSLIRKMAEKYRKQGRKVFVTTSTHMYIEKDTLLSDDSEEIVCELKRCGYVMAGVACKEKIGPLPKEVYEEVCKYADEILVEADGSRQMPLKYPGEQEPVIYDNAEEIIVVCGLCGLHKKAREVVHRWELIPEELGIPEDAVISAAHIQKLVRIGYMERLQKAYPEKKIRIQASHDGSFYQRALAKLLEADVDVSLLREEWFVPQPRLIVCGGGHVAGELVKMASCLDFYIKVIDDRAEFANEDRFSTANEVICDSFANLEKYLEPNSYYVVVTRGHQNDYECVKMILHHSYEYLGMIGSRLKVEKTFEKLQADGFSKEQVERIFAPIGLKIGAVTPAEIAVSILAQIIQEKNKKHRSSVSRELLEVKEKGTLCVIVEKTGSSPRGEGSMMYVTDSAVYDSIGGGAVEYAAVRDARTCQQVMVKEYNLSNEESEKLGMICGGKNKVLFIPMDEVK